MLVISGRRIWVVMILAMLAFVGCSSIVDDTTGMSTEESEEREDQQDQASEDDLIRSNDDIPIEPAEPTFVLTDEEWQERLTEEQYYVLREEGTERAFTGELHGNEREGIYHCAGCGHPLYSSEARFDSGTGWPSFWEPVNDEAVGTRADHSFGGLRVEVHCARCGGHQGHIFPDGPAPTGLRHCINSVAMEFSEGL